MNHFKPINIVDLLGVSPLTSITPEDIWENIVTPQCKALLGDILYSKISIKETVDGDFPGDEVYNHNGHKINGHDQKGVRFPYVQCFYKTSYGAFVVKYEGLKFKAFGWYGDMKKPQMIFKFAMRDRRFDGTKRTNDTALIDFPGYDESVNSLPQFPGAPEDLRFVEASVYGFMPGSRIVEACGDVELDKFVAQPYAYADKPELFLPLFWKAWSSQRGPGQHGNPIPDIARYVIPGFDKLARKAGYDYMENGASHYHVVRWTEAGGFFITSKAHKAVVDQLTAGIKRVKADYKARGLELTRQQESWLCVIQSLPSEFIPAEFNFHGPRWIQDNLSAVNLWMSKPISERAIAYEKQRPEFEKAAAEKAASEKAAAEKAAVEKATPETQGAQKPAA